MYNVRSWMKSITSTLFTQTLYYNDTYGGSTACYNGNISAMSWRVANEVINGTTTTKTRGYKFTYDNLSRLTASDYLENAVAKDYFNTVYTYDKHGNIKTLTRRGNTGTTTYGIIDNLTMSYSGNQLTKVEDTGTSVSLSASMDFKNGSNTATEYTYNKKGSLTKDANKGISSIAYNLLNLPRSLSISNNLGSGTNMYTYAADGTKLSTNISNKTTDYCGNVIYESGVLKRILIEGGYIEGGTYYFYLTDHLGNNRVVANASGVIVQSNHYYPYGMSFTEGTQTSTQPFKFGNKELDTQKGLNWYDFRKRQMTLDIPTFTTMDPLAEKYYSWSPYAYCAGNPMNNIDMNGDSIWFTSQYKDGELTKITMHVTGMVLNDSRGKIDMESATNNISTAIERAYEGKVDGVSFDTDVQLSVAKNMQDVSDSDHLFVLTDKITKLGNNRKIYGASNQFGGKVAFIDADYFSGYYDKALGSRNYGSFTAAHEFGHLLNLRHEDKSPLNIMRSNGMFYGTNSSQLRTIYNNWSKGLLNQDSNYILSPIGQKRPNVGKMHVFVKPW